jgi:predicted GIY-YIG superfamily endonuclease
MMIVWNPVNRITSVIVLVIVYSLIIGNAIAFVIIPSNMEIMPTTMTIDKRSSSSCRRKSVIISKWISKDQNDQQQDQQENFSHENVETNVTVTNVRPKQWRLQRLVQRLFNNIWSCILSFTIKSPWYKLCHNWIRNINRHRHRHRRYMTVYVLECEDGKYYIGSKTDWKQRWREHQSVRGGSSWTRRYRPIGVYSLYPKIPKQYALGWEAQITAMTMWKFGIQNVRGAMFSQSRLFHLEDLSALTGFLGHYNNLDYNEVWCRLRMQLKETTTLTDSSTNVTSYTTTTTTATANNNKITKSSRKHKNKFRRRQMYISESKDICFSCGQVGHWAKDCPQVWGTLRNIPSISQDYPL